MNAQDLKNSILQLAIQGKLVEQRKEEGNAKELLQDIKKIREELIITKKIKKEKELPEIAEEEIPFDLPENWMWVRLGDCCAYAFSGKSPKYTKTPNNNIAIGQRNNQNYGMDFTHLKYCTDEFMENYNEEMYLREYDILLNTLGGGTVGRTGLYINPHGFKCITDGHIFVFRTGVITFQKYLYYVLKAYQRKIERDAEGSTNQSFLKLGNVKSYLIPLPPLEEQKRIVAKIEELMPYVDKYDVAYSEVEKLNKKFPEDMQKSILQYAIQGKLVEQREEDGTAEELYKQIQEEKKKLIKEGKIKKTKDLPEITEDEIPFDIPENWKWVRLGDLGSYRKGPFGSALTKAIFVPKSENTVKVYEQKNAIQKDVNLGEYYITREYFESKMKGFELFPGDIIVSCAGTIGETYIMPDQFEQGIINQALMQMKLTPSVNVEYFLLYFDFILKKTARQSSKGSAIKNIPPFEELKSYLVPIPPLAEQKRIIERIEELLPYTKQLAKKPD